MNEYEIALEDRIHNLYVKINDLQQENKQIKAKLELYKDNEEYLNNKIDKAIEILHDDNYCHIEKLQKINEILGDIE